MARDEDRRIALNDFAGAGLPGLSYADGPCGIRGDDGATALPSALTLSATFDADLAQRYGDLLGAELVASGHNVLLGPELDIGRDPRAGRLAGGLGEDPLLTGELGGRIVRGVHAHRAIAVAKHFVCYNLERLRAGEGPMQERTDARDVLVGERELHELYLAPFRRAVERHGVVALLAAYVRVNGTYMAQSRDLLDVPRRLWGFEGFTVPDFLFAVRDAEAALAAGLDLPAMIVPGPPPLSERTPEMVDALDDDALARIGDHVRSAVSTAGLVAPTGIADTAALGTPEALRVAERVAIDGAVLLRNEGVLPLPAGARIALVGGEEIEHRLVTGGSAGVPLVGERLPGLETALESEGIRVAARAGGLPDVPVPPLVAGDGVDVSAVIEDSAGRRNVELAVAELPVDEIDHDHPWRAELTVVIPPHLGALVVAAEFAGEAQLLLDGTPVGSGFRDASPLLAGPHYVLRAVLPAATGSRTLVARFRTGPAFVFPAMGMVPRLSLGVVPLAPAVEAVDTVARDVDAVVVLAGRATGAGMDADDLGLPAGQAQVVEAAAATGTPVIVVTHGAGPIDTPWRDRVSALLHVGLSGERFAPALAAMLAGSAEPGGRLTLTWPDGSPAVPPADVDASGRLRYTEGVDIGYRSYERAGVEPAFWFGHGLGYADVELADAHADGQEVRVTLRAGAARGGKAVVQLYARPEAGETLKLVGFAAIRLESGQEATLPVAVHSDALCVWRDGTLRDGAGDYDVHVGFSRGDLRRTVTLRVG
ncbi:glycoside hydrolase family 3 protein [Microbacterium thalassium]|uniref:Beta-glucosidase n=1 Tax=Microbacterium thalassium TaxID=362649 RepID=A0A7X0KU64_9MICO|nr:glycoside hydrolase family 3 C-terminal domain-containing protein [Microbacterium thalassium]MBB6390840.1 beta-glucosidase [Microbacterium thalassium]